MLGMISTTVSFIVGSFLIFSCNTFGLKTPERQHILNSGSDIFMETIPNPLNTVNHYWIPKHLLDFKHVSATSSSHVNIAAQREISKANRESSKQQEFGLQGQVYGHDTKDKQQQLNRRLVSKTQTKKTMSAIKENVILNEDMSHQQKLPGIMDRLWAALNYGSLTELRKKNTLAATPPDANYWTVIKEKIGRGVLFVEIGGCLTASHVAADWDSNSVVVSLLSKDLYNECISNTRESGLRNFIIGSVTQVQQMVESLFSDQAVAIEHLFLSNLQVLWQSLLPHECEDLLSKLLALSWRVYIVNPTVKIGHVSLYTRWWASLRSFLQICCQKRNIHCTIDLLNGTNSWESAAIYQVTLKSGYRQIIDSSKKQQSFQMKPDKYLKQDTRDKVISQLNNNSYSFAVLTNGVSLSKESIQVLFLTCLQIPAPLWNKMMHLPFITLKPFHLHIYWPNPLLSKILIKTETQKYTKAFKSYQTFKPDQTLDYDAVGEFWDREVIIKDRHKSANEREVAISNAFWDRDGSFLGGEIKKNVLPFWGDDIWNREELEESLRHNRGMFKSSNRFKNQAEKSLLHHPEGSFHLSKWRSFQDNNNLPDLVNGISAIRQEYFTIQRKVFSKMPFFQHAQKPPLFSSPRKITLRQGKKLIFSTKQAKFKRSLSLSRKLAKIDENVELNQNNMSQEIPFIKSKIVLNKIHPNYSKIIQQQIFQYNDLRNSTWNKDRFKWNLPRFHPFQLDFTPPILKMAEYISMNKNRFIGNKVKDQVRKAKFSSKMMWNQRQSKLGKSRIKREFFPGQSREDQSMSNGMKIQNNFENMLKMEQIKNSKANNEAQEKEKKDGTDERLYHSQWDAVKFLFKQKLNGNFSLLVYGSKHLTLLAAKTGLLYPHSTVLNIVPVLDAAFANMYRDVLPPNVLTAINDLDAQIINTISRLPNLFRFQILGVDIFSKILWLKEGFIEYLGNILSLAQATIFTVPKLEQFILAQMIFNGTEDQNHDFSFKKLILKAAAMIGEEVNIEIIKEEDLGDSLLFVELKHLKREVVVDCSHGKGLLILESVSSFTTFIQTNNSVMSFDTRTIVLSLLLALKLEAADKKQLFLCYLDLPIYKDMCPHLIFWSSQCLSHSDQQTHTQWKYKPFSLDSDSNLLARIFTKELMESSAPFSFLEYQSEGSLINQLAEIFPNSTFIAVMQDSQTATTIYQKAVANNLENLLVTQHTVDDIFTLKLLRSPEFFRYQFIGYKCFLNLASALSRKKFNLMMGQLLSVSVSSFLILPSEKILSLGLLSFYPEFHLDQWSELDHNSEKNIYLSTNHPSTFYKNAERKIIFESAQADVQAEVEAITSQHFHFGEGKLFPWRLLRVNIKNLTTQVEHHFESYLDGHTRTYIQHCTSLGNTHYKVHLQRQSDGLMIPYGNIHAITLISLLRIGLLAEIQKKLYYKFLKLPLYEDMAPWNIVFSAGQLEYIDFDTKNKTFDFVAPMAYQIMSMLMNYERTIRDFGKCKSQAKTQFGFGFISNCVGSDFLGPCKDSLQPVPCGDHTCRSTFIECLQALAKAENNR